MNCQDINNESSNSFPETLLSALHVNNSSSYNNYNNSPNSPPPHHPSNLYILYYIFFFIFYTVIEYSTDRFMYMVQRKQTFIEHH